MENYVDHWLDRLGLTLRETYYVLRKTSGRYVVHGTSLSLDQCGLLVFDLLERAEIFATRMAIVVEIVELSRADMLSLAEEYNGICTSFHDAIRVARIE